MTSLRATILFVFLLALGACAGQETGTETDDLTEETDPSEDGDKPPPKGGKDGGGSSVNPAKDAGGGGKNERDGGAQNQGSKDAGPQPNKDAGESASDAGKSEAKDAGGGFVFPPLFPPAAPADAGSAPKDAGSSTSDAGKGGRDPYGPCKDLNLFCFDPIDMFIFNPDCFTCNGGKGCMGCAIPFAY